MTSNDNVMSEQILANDAPPLVRQKKPIRPIFSSRPKRIWLISFTDFMSLMVAFFVMMYSMADPQLEKFKQVSGAFEDQFAFVQPEPQRSFQGAPLTMGDVESVTLPRVVHKEGLDIGYLTQVVQKKKSEISDLKGLTLRPEADYILLQMPLADVFAGVGAGGAVSSRVIKGLVSLLMGMQNQTELVIEVPSEKDIPNGMIMAHLVARTMRGAGYTPLMPILVHQSRADAAPTLTLRMTQYGDDSPAPE